MMYYGNIKTNDIANGEGVRTALFVSGCRNRCKGCFNPETWSFTYGKPFDEAAESEILESLKPKHIAGLTILGGDPMEEENQRALLPLVQKVKERFPHKSIWLYTGYILERDLLEGGRKNIEVTLGLLKTVDVLVDGPFEEEFKNISLAFRGSENQRIIKLKDFWEAKMEIE